LFQQFLQINQTTATFVKKSISNILNIFYFRVKKTYSKESPMIATKKINWGIIGLGNIANAFAKDLSLVPNATLRAVASRTKKKAKEFAKNHGAEKAYGSYEKLFKDDAIDIIYIATPHNSHANLSIAAMKAGKAVLCEKPLAVNKKQVKKMIKTAKKQKVFMMEAFWSKFNPSVKQSIDLAKNGRIGDVNYVNVDFSFYKEAPVESRMFNLELAGGALLDLFLANLIKY